jgi:CRP/FNR family cyclic AMP-dependent transcriptional regulator
MEQIKDIETRHLIENMNRIDFFNAFSDEEKREIVASYTPVCVFGKNESIIKEGANDIPFYILLTGSARAMKNDVSLPFAEYGPGDSFGEISFLTGVPRTCDVTANEVSIALKIDKKTLEDLKIEIREKIKDKIIENLVDRLKIMNNAFITLFQ